MLQHQLKDFDYYHNEIDGIFGSRTYKAVNDFQKDNGLRTDGIAGPNTKKALKKVHSLQLIYKKAGLLGDGDRGNAVKTLQNQLHVLNYYHGHLDGVYGPLTEGAVKAFQKANHIAIDGVAGPRTFAALTHHPVRQTAGNNGVKETTVSRESSQKTVVKSTHTKVDKGENKQPVNDTNSKERKSTQGTASTESNVDGQNVSTFYVESTAYTAECSGCSGVTATGMNLKENPGAKVIAVDPNVIPLGSKVWVEGYGYAVAGDTGGAINGKRIDLFMPSHSDASSWGRKTVKVKVYR